MKGLKHLEQCLHQVDAAALGVEGGQSALSDVRDLLAGSQPQSSGLSIPAERETSLASSFLVYSHVSDGRDGMY